jgi:hypothetical protein
VFFILVSLLVKFFACFQEMRGTKQQQAIA